MANVGKGVAIARLASAKIPSLQELLVSLGSFRACLSEGGVNMYVASHLCPTPQEPFTSNLFLSYRWGTTPRAY